MVKGTSRQVIVVNGTEEMLFDQASFILRVLAGGAGGSDEALRREAKGCLEVPGRRRAKWLHNGPVWGAVGAGLAWLLTILL